MGLADALTLRRKVNVIGVVGALLLFYAALSNRPWWTLVGGSGEEYTFAVTLSPFMFAAEILGKPMTISIIPYLNLAARLSMLLAAATTLAGSMLVAKPWSKPMISTKGLTIPIIFLLGVFIGTQAALYMGLNIPVVGEFVLKYVVNAGGVEIVTETPSKAAITSEYWIALAAGIISIIAKVVQGRIAGKEPLVSQRA